jgi:hypothetical protein
MRREQDCQQHPQDIESQDKVLLTESDDPILQCDVHLPGLDDASNSESTTKQSRHLGHSATPILYSSCQLSLAV